MLFRSVGFIGKKVPGSIVGMFSAILQVVCFLQLGWFTGIYPIYSVLGLAILLGSMGTCIYAPVSRLIHYNELGLALGILKSAESISWLITPPIYGYIYEATGTYAWSCTFFAAMGALALPLQLAIFLTRRGLHPPVEDIKIEDAKSTSKSLPSESEPLTKSSSV